MNADKIKKYEVSIQNMKADLEFMIQDGSYSKIEIEEIESKIKTYEDVLASLK